MELMISLKSELDWIIAQIRDGLVADPPYSYNYQI